jgi:Transmembrane family 220, helix
MTFSKVISLLCTLIFGLFAYFQLNDPDPQYWVPVYLIVALACFSVFIKKTPHTFVFWVMAGAYLVAAIMQWPPQFEGFLFGEMQMRSLNIELARESGGLLISSLSLVLMGWLSKR